MHALACACACHPVYVCVKQEMKQERERVSEGKIQQDIKGAERFSSGRERKGNSEGVVELRWGGGGGCVEGGGGRGEGGLADYPLHLAQLCRPTHSHQSGTPICPRLSQPLSTPHVTPYILLFMLNN